MSVLFYKKQINKSKAIIISSFFPSRASFNPQQSFFGLPTTKIGPSEMGFTCPLANIPSCNPQSKYRRIDGACNNLNNPNLGKSETGFKRYSQPLYNDGKPFPATFSRNFRKVFIVLNTTWLQTWLH